MAEMLSVDKQGWIKELASIKEYYAQFGDRLPRELLDELAVLENRLGNV
jgi:phosphoenolpyruvate carboxykinase (GTP)